MALSPGPPYLPIASGSWLSAKKGWPWKSLATVNSILTYDSNQYLLSSVWNNANIPCRTL